MMLQWVVVVVVRWCGVVGFSLKVDFGFSVDGFGFIFGLIYS